MVGLTVTEKEHWKERIARHIDRRIAAIEAEEPNLMDRVKREARDRALESLGLAALQTEQDEAKAQRESLRKREEQIQRPMLAHVRGIDVDAIKEGYYVHSHDHEIEKAVATRQEVHEDELLAESSRGQSILRLREERENLLDVVWLATSGADLRLLWSKVTALLGDQPTQLERDALAIPPLPTEA
jgi:hypothetical protein